MQSIVRLLCLGFFCLLMAMPVQAQPDDGGPGGGGPGDPPRPTPGLEPAILAGVAAAGYFGFRAFKKQPPKE